MAAIDLAKGKLVHLSKSRKGFVPGNLICYKGRVISQGYDGVDVFYQLDSATVEIQQRLAANPTDSDALCLQGEIFLDTGKRAEAIDCFRRAYAADTDPTAANCCAMRCWMDCSRSSPFIADKPPKSNNCWMMLHSRRPIFD